MVWRRSADVYRDVESIVVLIVSIVEPINQWRDGGDIFLCAET